ncbi:MAG: hypothetical protein NVSMB46_03300 [Candidatus Saccharimonadales bacterium]
MNDPIEKRLEALLPNQTPEEACLSALLDLNDFQEKRSSKAVSNFYATFTGNQPSDDFRTRIDTHPVEQNPQEPPHYSPQKSYVEGLEIAATVIVDFDSREDRVGRMLNLDFVRTPSGIRLMQRELFRHGETAEMRYTRVLTKDELDSLARDAIAVKDLIVEEGAELMKLGSLVEKQAEDGSRRFHIGDVLSITTSRVTSPRGMEGIYDILGYMTDDRPFSTQLSHFAEECSPHLKQQLGEILKPYSEIPATVLDTLSMYKWLQSITDKMNGDPFLKVDKIGKKYHRYYDPDN